MIKALEARDGKRLAEILRRHILEKRDAVLINPAHPISLPLQSDAR